MAWGSWVASAVVCVCLSWCHFRGHGRVILNHCIVRIRAHALFTHRVKLDEKIILSVLLVEMGRSDLVLDNVQACICDRSLRKEQVRSTMELASTRSILTIGLVYIVMSDAALYSPSIPSYSLEVIQAMLRIAVVFQGGALNIQRYFYHLAQPCAIYGLTVPFLRAYNIMIIEHVVNNLVGLSNEYAI